MLNAITTLFLRMKILIAYSTKSEKDFLNGNLLNNFMKT